jgi:hypothetical protein
MFGLDLVLAFLGFLGILIVMRAAVEVLVGYFSREQ